MCPCEKKTLFIKQKLPFFTESDCSVFLLLTLHLKVWEPWLVLWTYSSWNCTSLLQIHYPAWHVMFPCWIGVSWVGYKSCSSLCKQEGVYVWYRCVDGCFNAWCVVCVCVCVCVFLCVCVCVCVGGGLAAGCWVTEKSLLFSHVSNLSLS